MANQVGSSRVDTVLKMLLIAFISLLAFSSGVFFGKQMSDSDFKLKALESDFNHSTKTASEHAKETDVAADALMDDEVASLSEKFVATERDDLNETVGAESTKPENAKTAVKETSKEAKQATRKNANNDKMQGKANTASSTSIVKGPKGAPVVATEEEEAPHVAANTGRNSETSKPDLSAAHRAAVRVANNTTPTESENSTNSAPTTYAGHAGHEPSRAPSALPRTVGTSGEVEFTVQIASYPTADAAKAHATELVKKGFPAFPVEATVGGKTWYRVSVGSFKSMREATTYRVQLLKQADLQSAIVQRIQR